MSKKSRKQRQPMPTPSLHVAATKADYDDTTEMAYWLAPNGRITALKQGSGMYGAGYPQFIDGAVGPNIPLSFTPMGFAAAYTVSTWLYRCVEVRKQAIDRMPWSVVNVRRKNDAVQHPLFVALKRNHQHLLRQIEQSQLIYGESFIELAMNDFNYTSDLYWLNNLGMAVLIGVGEIMGYSYTALNGGMSQGFAPDQVAFMRTENPFNDLRGMSPVEVVLDEVAIDKDVARVVRSFYANDTRVGMLLIPKRDLNDADAERFMDLWKMQNQGVNKAGKPVLVPQDLTVERAQTPPSLDDVELRESTRRDICAGLGVPLAIAGAWDDANYDSVDTQRKSFYEETVIPECDRITGFINNDIMPAFDPSGLYRFEFDYTATMALIEDAVQKTEIYSTRLNSGMITRAEARAAIGHEVRPEDDVFYIPTGVTVVPANQPAYVTPNTNIVEDNPQQQQQLSQGQIDAPKDKPALPASVDEKPASDTAPEDKPEEKATVKVEIITEDLMLSELAAWQKKVSNKGAVKGAVFECRYLPGDVSDIVRTGLSGGVYPRDVFSTARHVMEAVKALDGTKQTWMAFFKTTVREAMSGRLSKAQAYALLSNRLQRSGEDAYRDALRENGITELDEFDQFQIDQWNGEQQGYLSGFVDELFSTGLTPEQADTRAEMWAGKSVQDAYMAALTSVDKNGNYVWQYNPEADHCPDCEKLNGQVHRLAEWEKRSLRPKSDVLNCKLGCKCELTKTTDAAKGRFLG